MTQAESYLSGHGLVATVEMLLAGPEKYLGMTEAHAADMVRIIERLFQMPADRIAMFSGSIAAPGATEA